MSIKQASLAHIALALALVASVLEVRGNGTPPLYGRGVHVVRESAHAWSFTVRPETELDTFDVAGRQYISVGIPEARIRQSASGGTVQLVVEFSLNVSSPTSFTLAGSTVHGVVHGLPMRAIRTPNGTPIPTEAILTNKIQVQYGGVARGQHQATVRCVVAESIDGNTWIATELRGVIELSPAAILAEQSSSLHRSQTSLRKGTEQTQSFVPLDPVAQITVSEEGVYRISAQQLRDAGLPTDANAARTIKVLGWGGQELDERVDPATNDAPNELDVIVRTNADGSINEVLFYAAGNTGWQWTSEGARHYIHHYDTKARYLVTTAGGDGRRSTKRTTPTGPVEHRPLTVFGYAFNEEELVNPYNSGSGRKWFGRTIENGGSLVVTFTLPGLVRSGEVSYNMNLVHKSSYTGSFTVYENNIPVAQRVLQPVPEYMDMFSGRAYGSVPAAQIASDARSVLRFEYKCPQEAIATGLLDWVEVIYPRGLVADSRRFAFFSDPKLRGVTEYSVNGFEGGEVFAFDVTDPAQPKQLENVAPSGGVAAIRELLDSGKVRRYFITTEVRGVSISPLPPLTLRSRAVADQLGNYLVITHPELKESAEEYAAYRGTDPDLRISVVTSEEIMREFAFGVQDPTAIRDFLAFAYWHAPTRPAYVLLWGDGHFDYKGISTTARNYLIPFESLDPDDTSYGLQTHTTEDFFVRIDGNDLRPDIAIGRLPITSNDVGRKMLAKIRDYEQSASLDDWRTRITMVADDGYTAPGASDRALHLKQSETLWREYIPESFQPKKIYLVEYPTSNIARGKRKPSVTAEIVSTVNTTGALMLNWIGHGNPRVWAHEFVFERETTPPRMTNRTKPFFLSAATCDFARFDLTDVQSGAEELVLLEEGGAIAAFSAARIVFADQNAALNQAFYRILFTPDVNGRTMRIGDAVRQVKQDFYNYNDEKFFLLADPTLRLLIPDHEVVFESINGQPLSDSAIVQLKALSTVTVTGRIERPLSSTVDASFNGVATISLLDGQRDVTVVDDDVYQTVNSFILPGALLARGSYPVVDGRFTAQFVVPKDIAFSASEARLYGYAYNTEDRRTACGVTSNVVVDGVSDEQHNDGDGPSIAIYMDSYFFQRGDVVRANPILIVDLEDATGINAAGVGVGHDIEATFDDGALVEVLTETFSTSLKNPRAGTASKQIFGLGSGEHTVRVRAWDVLNNMQEASTMFRIASSDDGVVARWVMNFPNPFSEATTIRFQHNANRPFTADVRIYDMQGRMVMQSPMDVRDMQTAEFVWNGRDAENNHLGSGVYACQVIMVMDDGTSASINGKLALIR